MDLALKGKRAIVTGASRGIGKACALALAAEGARVCVAARNEEMLAQTVKDVDAAGGEGMYVSADLTEIEGCKAVVDACVENWGGVDILVNNAGAAGGGDILDLRHYRCVVIEVIRLSKNGAVGYSPYAKEFLGTHRQHWRWCRGQSRPRKY
ncbi:MAG: SDR family oxidoreductase, partial [Rhodospirillales bacterium]|nr:SDR family oxidoreductase [Rhodospirillales bacterium]